MKIGLLPLDERPVNVRYPQMIADVAGAAVVMPPAAVLPALREPAQTDALAVWLREQAPMLDVLIVSVEMLGYGGLIASRTTHDDTLDVLQRLHKLRTIRRANPHLTIYAFNVITRISGANNNVEEPLYWDQYGRRLHQYSQQMHRHGGDTTNTALSNLLDQIPPEYIQDFTRRRLRNHQVNLATLDMLTEGTLDLLVISSDDTSEYGFGSQEKAWLQTWRDRLRPGDDRLLMYPGADEIGSVFVVRAITEGTPPPRFYVQYAVPGDEDNIAPYEDGPVRVTVERQVRAINGVIVEELAAADLILAVNPPSRIGGEYDPTASVFQQEHARRDPHIRRFVNQIAVWQSAGQPVIVADVGYPNGSDPFLIEQMLAHDGIDLTRLAAYGAWNTAGNTIGTAIAQGVASLHSTTDDQRTAQQRFLLHRFLEDWGYQHVVRQQVRDWLTEQTGQHDPTADNLSTVPARVEAGLRAQLARLPQFAAQWALVPGGVRLPWNRTFEVDFDLEQR